jgi:23S rRNA (uracil1939-C5)-methyltransferase
MDIGSKRNEVRGSGKRNEGRSSNGSKGKRVQTKSGNRSANVSGKGDKGKYKDKGKWGNENRNWEKRGRDNGEGSRGNEGKEGRAVNGKANEKVNRNVDGERGRRRNESVNREWEKRGKGNGEGLQTSEGKAGRKGSGSTDRAWEKRGRGNGESLRTGEGKVSKKGNGNADREWNGRRTESVNGEWKAQKRGTSDSSQTYGVKGNGREDRSKDNWRKEGIKGASEKGGKFRMKNKDSRCKVSEECGGCKMIDVPYSEQLLWKQRETEKLLKPFVKLEGIIGMEEPEHYRNKVNAAFTHDRKGKPLSGVYKEGTHYIIPVEECLLENKKADEIIASIRELLPSFKIKTYDEDTGYGLLRHVMVRVGYTSGQIMVVLVLASPILPSKNNFVKALLNLQPDITTIVINVNDRKTSMVLGDKEQVIYGKGYIEDSLNGKSFKISPKSFYQVNSVQTQKLYGKAIEYAGLTGKETILDAYCGIGTIGIMAADKAKQVIGVELNKDAVKDAIINAKQNKISNIQFYQKDAGEFMVQLAEQGTQIDTVFMDPPRAGSDEVFLNSLVALKPKKVVYISCNPETLARDLEYLVKRGYRGVTGVVVDMFPFTNHVETTVLLQRRDAAPGTLKNG